MIRWLAGDMHIRELLPSEAESCAMNQAREIFITYFTHLYEHISVEILGIDHLNEYLSTIFERTKIALSDKEVRAFLLYIHGQPGGFAVCSVSEDLNMVLIRTLPIALDYKDQEYAIRQYIFEHIKNKFSGAMHAVMVVRKLNQAYRSFCEDNGFKKNNSLFTQSAYLQKTYNNDWYDVYEYDL